MSSAFRTRRSESGFFPSYPGTFSATFTVKNCVPNPTPVLRSFRPAAFKSTACCGAGSVIQSTAPDSYMLNCCWGSRTTAISIVSHFTCAASQ